MRRLKTGALVSYIPVGGGQKGVPAGMAEGAPRSRGVGVQGVTLFPPMSMASRKWCCSRLK